MPDLRMPSLGADMESGTLVRWHVKPGDAVRRGDVVAEVETQKGVFDIDVRQDAVIGEQLVAEGTRVKVGAPILRLEPALTPGARPAPQLSGPVTAPAEAPIPVPPTAPKAAVPPVGAAPDGSAAGPTGAGRAARPRASPLARRIASERGIDLSTVSGTGEHGVITRADVEAAATGATPGSATEAPMAEGLEPMVPTSGMRAAIGAAMSRSKRDIPHYYLSEDIDLHAALSWLQATNAARPLPDRLLPAALLLKAVARAIARFPELNGLFVDGRFQPAQHIHLGVAITLRGGGLVAPAIHDADALSVSDLMAALVDLVRRARQGGLRASEITDPTVTVTNLGDEGVRTVYGVITPPQVAIIGFGAIADRPWAEDGLIGVRPVVTATLSGDHRVSDGWRGARFLREVQRWLRTPEEL